MTDADQTDAFTGGGDALVDRIQQQFDAPLARELTEYLRSTVPARAVRFDDGRGGVTLWGADRVGFGVPDGPPAGAAQAWDDHWLILADAPDGWTYLVDVAGTAEVCPVQLWAQGSLEPVDDETGEAQPVASSIANFLEVLTALHARTTGDLTADAFEAQLQQIEPDQDEVRAWWLTVLHDGEDAGA